MRQGKAVSHLGSTLNDMNAFDNSPLLPEFFSNTFRNAADLNYGLPQAQFGAVELDAPPPNLRLVLDVDP